VLTRALGALPKGAKPPKPGDSSKKLSDAQRAVVDAEKQQLAAAQALVAVWQGFDAALDSTPELIGTPLTLSALALNDAPLSHALWFQAHPDLAALPPRVRDEPDLATRIGMAPIRIAWVRRYLKTLSPEVQQLVAQQESARFEQDETAALDFERAYMAYRNAASGNADANTQAQLRDLAAQAAGKLSLYAQPSKQPSGSQAFGLTLLAQGAPASEHARKAVDEAYSMTRLRLL